MKSRVIPLRRLVLVSCGQIAMATTMGYLGMVDQHTVIPACYFAVVQIVLGVILAERT